VWQVLYEELQGRNIEFIAVALDTGGNAAAENSIRAPDLAERPAMLRPLMGWGEDEWSRMAPPTYPCLIDTEHVVADLYGITNVPMAVWIDEEGRIVRPAETAGHSDYFRRMDRETFEVPEEDAEAMITHRHTYWDALRDWAAKGADSEFALEPDEVRRRMQRPDEAHVRAGLHARIGRHLYETGEWEAAKRQFEEAVALRPEAWNYRRQSMVLEPELVGGLNVAPEFWAAQDALGADHYYPPVDMPGMPDPPPWLKEARD
jgi:hypothetical protein